MAAQEQQNQLNELKKTMDQALAVREKAVKRAIELYHTYRQSTDPESRQAHETVWSQHLIEVLNPADKEHNDASLAYWNAYYKINGLHRITR